MIWIDTINSDHEFVIIACSNQAKCSINIPTLCQYQEFQLMSWYKHHMFGEIPTSISAIRNPSGIAGSFSSKSSDEGCFGLLDCLCLFAAWAKVTGFGSDGHGAYGSRCSWSADSTIWEPGIKGCIWASAFILVLTWAASVMLRVGGYEYLTLIAPGVKTPSCYFTLTLHFGHCSANLLYGSSSLKLCRQTQ